jgi:hypothetical protein
MKTKRFELELLQSNYHKHGIDIKVRVHTDHATHTATQRYEVNGKPRYLRIELGREYTSDQRAVAEEFCAYHYPTVVKKALEWIQKHNFHPSDNIDLHLNSNFDITRAGYEV